MMRTDAIRPAAVTATNYARRLVRQLKTTFEIVEHLDGKLRDARQSLEHARQVRENDLATDAKPRRERSQRFADLALTNARQNISGWRNAVIGMVGRLSRTVAGLERLLDDLTDRGCRAVLKRLIDDHEPTRFGDCEPTAWETLTACSLAKRVLFVLSEVDGDCPQSRDLDEIGIEAELNLAIPMTENVLRMLDSVASLERLDLDLKRDQVTLGAAADEAEPNDDRLALKYFAAELLASGAEYPGGSVELHPVRLSGLTPEAESRLRQIVRHAIPHMRALGADPTEGTLDDNAERIAEWLVKRPAAQSHQAEPFVFMAEGLARFLDDHRGVKQLETPEKAVLAKRFRDLAADFRDVASTQNGRRQLLALEGRAGVILRQAAKAGAVNMPAGWQWAIEAVDTRDRQLAERACGADWTSFAIILDIETGRSPDKTGLPHNLMAMIPQRQLPGFALSVEQTEVEDWPIRARNYAAVCDWLADGNDSADPVGAVDRLVTGRVVTKVVKPNACHDILITLTQLAEVTGKPRRWFDHRRNKFPEPVVKASRGDGRTASEWRIGDIIPVVERENKPVADKLKTWWQSQSQA